MVLATGKLVQFSTGCSSCGVDMSLLCCMCAPSKAVMLMSACVLFQTFLRLEWTLCAVVNWNSFKASATHADFYSSLYCRASLGCVKHHKRLDDQNQQVKGVFVELSTIQSDIHKSVFHQEIRGHPGWID